MAACNRFSYTPNMVRHLMRITAVLYSGIFIGLPVSIALMAVMI